MYKSYEEIPHNINQLQFRFSCVTNGVYTYYAEDSVGIKYRVSVTMDALQQACYSYKESLRSLCDSDTVVMHKVIPNKPDEHMLWLSIKNYSASQAQ